MGGQSGVGRRWAAALLYSLAGLVTAAGLIGALGVWAIMAFYPDDQPNTWLQNLGPLLVYTLPAFVCAIALAAAARRLGSRSR
jgi:hypothetical protein